MLWKIRLITYVGKPKGALFGKISPPPLLENFRPIGQVFGFPPKRGRLFGFPSLIPQTPSKSLPPPSESGTCPRMVDYIPWRFIVIFCLFESFVIFFKFYFFFLFDYNYFFDNHSKNGVLCSKQVIFDIIHLTWEQF